VLLKKPLTKYSSEIKRSSVGCLAYEEEGACRILARKPEGKKENKTAGAETMFKGYRKGTG
jgi:hypothetical protein